MTAELIIPQSTSKSERYESLIPQIGALISDEDDLIANLSNITSALKYGMGFFWVGFYLVKGNELVLGPFQGTVGCTRIEKGKGVCGASWAKRDTIIVEDVDQFPGHIACSSESKSEIVLPVFQKGEVELILDIDSNKLADFDQTDLKYLKQLVELIESSLII